MDLSLNRTEFRPDGIFGELKDNKFNLIAYTLEHAYQQPDGSWAPKIPNGSFSCIRGPHRLHNMTSDFITFEITGIEGHSNLLFHWGNWNNDSEGCILLGEGITGSSKGQMIINSKAIFAEFMSLQAGLDNFQLTIS